MNDACQADGWPQAVPYPAERYADSDWLPFDAEIVSPGASSRPSILLATAGLRRPGPATMWSSFSPKDRSGEDDPQSLGRILGQQASTTSTTLRPHARA
jgi:hypothetical protein